jgi:hypothetical protein
MQTIGVLCGGFPAAELCQAGVAQIFHDPADLLVNFDRSLICAGRNEGAFDDSQIARPK